MASRDIEAVVRHQLCSVGYKVTRIDHIVCFTSPKLDVYVIGLEGDQYHHLFINMQYRGHHARIEFSSIRPFAADGVRKPAIGFLSQRDKRATVFVCDEEREAKASVDADEIRAISFNVDREPTYDAKINDVWHRYRGMQRLT